ncbi:MAG: type II toxin-antitoxin system RelB/DinJ family antitoxin [Bacteroidales bacterium]|nr:type II toxin-antitoxin system RelB/DinJ family antitoxin [Bacteroidales bacterium]
MAQVVTTIRMEAELKSQFDRLCSEFGMSINTAFNIFAKAVVRSGSIPFKIEIDSSNPLEEGRKAFYELRRQAREANVDMTLEEINAEIAAVRAKRQ